MPLKVFYSYAHEDNKLRGLLEKHLNLLKRQNLIEDWHDRNINAGKEWAREIDTNLATADIFLLLISPDFVYSDYCYSIEMKRALQRHENGTARVIPVILRPGDYDEAPFSKLQALPTNAVPVTDRKWRNRDEAFLDIAQGIRATVKELLSEKWVDEGDIYFYRQQYTEALEAYEKAISLNPLNALAYVGQGRTLNKLALNTRAEYDQHRVKALNAFDRAIGLDPTIADAYVGKGNVLLKFFPFNWRVEITIDKSMILDAYNQAIRLNPMDEEAYIGKADTFRLFHKYEDALAAYEEALKLMSSIDRVVYNNKADLLYELGRYEDALPIYEQIACEFPDRPYAYGGKGNTLYKLGRYDEAIQAYEKAIALGYYDPILLHAQKGRALFQLKKYPEALTAYDQAIQLFGEQGRFADVYRSKGELLQVMADEAFKIVEEMDVIEDHPF
jgi:tetratricopeptide (TPR) repeat protein